MKFSHPFLLPSLLLLPFLNSGCSLFTPVGEAISGVYENTVSYFNSYYNAKRTFDDAEDEIRAATRVARAKTFQQSREFVVPAASKQKLTVVIDKCSSILSFHPTSSLVDNALLLIGKSYFYQAEYVKAERKFLELSEQFPSSSLMTESRLWHARTLDRLKKRDEAIVALTNLTADAEAAGEEEIAAEAHVLLADQYELREDRELAIRHYSRVVELDAGDDLKTDAQFRIADLFFSTEQLEQAAAEYARIPEFTLDVNLEFRAKLQISVCTERQGKHEEALALTEELLQDFRFRDFGGLIRLERARILHGGGRRDESIEEYKFLDTAFVRTETGALASFELGNIYEKEFRDYAAAKPFYTRAAENRTTSIYSSAQRKSTALNGYLEAKKRISRHDSLLSAYRDQVHTPTSDTLASPVKVNEDSLNSLNAALFYDIAEVFYAELSEPDSAVYWYRRSLALKSDSTQSPRILFILAEIANSHPDRDFGNAGDYYKKLVDQYPDSKYAEQARDILRLPKKEKENDPAEKFFIQAESLIEANQYQKAVGLFTTIVDNFSKSPYAAKSEYATAWLYEYRLSKPDSALAHYKILVDRYASSTYAALVKPRISDSSDARKDSVGTLSPKPPPSREVKDEEPKVKPAVPDTLGSERRKVNE